VFPYTQGSQVDTFGLGTALDSDSVSTITVEETDGSPSIDTDTVIFNSEAFYVERDSAGKAVVNFRPDAADGITDHGALTGLGDNDHPQYLLRTETPPGFYGIVFRESDGSYVERDDTLEFASDDFDLSTVGGKPRVKLGDVITAEAFYLSGDGDLSAITRNITLQYPGSRDTITFFSAESDFRVTRMRAILRTKDSGFYPYVNFTLRHGAAFPSRGSGTELETEGWQCGFYPGHPYLTADKNPLVVTTFDSSTILKDSYVWLETTKLGEGNGVEEELAISLWIER